jgi:hypothetical protein
MGTLERLLFWGYEPDEAVAILEKYRWREKLQRRDYVEGMLKKLLPPRETAKPKKETEHVEKKRLRRELKDSGVLLDGGCFEAIYHGGKPCFLLKKGENFTVTETIEVGGAQFLPKEARNIPYEPYGYFEGPVPTLQQLFDMVRGEIESYIDIEDVWKDILAVCVLLTYQQEKLNSVPYVFLYGDNESGKSTVLKVLSKLCYRPLYGVTIPSADLFGYLEDSDSVGCILEDEVQGVHKDTDKIKIYKAGYSKGAKVPRIIVTQNDKYIKYYNCFCFKACASEQIPQVKGFNERFIFISMVEGCPPKEWSDLTREDVERLSNLRNMLLKWRMQTRGVELPTVDLNVKGRLKELWKPLLQVSSGLTVFNTLSSFLLNQQKERLTGKQETLEGKIVKVVVNLFNSEMEGLPVISFSKIWSELTEELEGKIDKEKSYVMHTSEFDDVTKNKVGYRLREVLSGKSRVKREKDLDGRDVVVKAYEFNPEKLSRVARKYGYTLVTKLPSLLSSEGVEPPKNAEKSVESMEQSMEKEGRKEGASLLQLGKLSNLVTNPLNPEKLGYSDIKSVFWSDQFYDKHVCAVCGYERLTSWQAETFKGDKVWLCEDCKAEWEKRQEEVG